MHQLIKRLLDKRGIKEVTELSQEEQETFDTWDKILSSEGDITVEKIATFCKEQLNKIEAQWGDLDNTELKNRRLVTQHTVYRAMLNVIQAPEEQREQLERYLNQLITTGT